MSTMISEVYSAFKSAGVPEQEARQAAEALSAENLATRNIIAEDKRELGEVRQEVTAEISGVRLEIAGLREEVTREIAGVRLEIAGVRKEMTSEIAGVRLEIAGVRKEMTSEIAGVRLEIAGVRQEMTRESGEIKRGMGIMQWMLGLVLIVLVLPILRDIAAQISTG